MIKDPCTRDFHQLWHMYIFRGCGQYPGTPPQSDPGAAQPPSRPQYLFLRETTRVTHYIQWHFTIKLYAHLWDQYYNFAFWNIDNCIRDFPKSLHTHNFRECRKYPGTPPQSDPGAAMPPSLPQNLKSISQGNYEGYTFYSMAFHNHQVICTFFGIRVLQFCILEH